MALTKSNRPLKENDILNIDESEVFIEILQKDDYLSKIKFSKNIEDVIEGYGVIPIPPYLNRDPQAEDYKRYQTVYANHGKERSSAAPTAGLHFENSLLDSIKNNSILKSGAIFNTDNLSYERDRISNYLRNRGFYSFNKEFIYLKERPR